jgi:hypothetical protein
MDKRIIAAGAVGIVLVGGLLCVGLAGGGFLYYQQQQAVAELTPDGDAEVGSRPAAEMPSLIPAALLGGSDTSLPWPVPGIGASQCQDLTDGGPIQDDGFLTGELHCDETIIGHTRGGVQLFDTEFYEQGFCTPATTQHDGGDERIYLFRAPPGRHRVYWTLDTPCADLDVTAIRWKRPGYPKLSDARGLADCETLRKDGTERERISSPSTGEEVWLIVVEGEGDNEGAFALTAQCGPWR